MMDDKRIFSAPPGVEPLDTRQIHTSPLYAEIDRLNAELAEARAQLAPIPDPSVRAIVAAYLLRHGYDGLYDEPEAPDCCVCSLKDGLMDNCDSCGGGSCCVPGYRTLCTCGEDHDYHIEPEKSGGGAHG